MLNACHSTVNIIPGHNNSWAPSWPKIKNSVNTFPEIILSEAKTPIFISKCTTDTTANKHLCMCSPHAAESSH